MGLSHPFSRIIFYSKKIHVEGLWGNYLTGTKTFVFLYLNITFKLLSMCLALSKHWAPWLRMKPSKCNVAIKKTWPK